jgi:rubrerythrin
MKLITASAAISFSEKLESDSAKFYEDLAHKFPGAADMCLSFSEENRKLFTAVQRAYYSVISDALEGCFCFEAVDTDDYPINTDLADVDTQSEALARAVEQEQTIIRFYTAAYEASRSLIADVAMAFRKTARKRGARISALQALQS